jgi:hypothetical protein
MNLRTFVVRVLQLAVIPIIFIAIVVPSTKAASDQDSPVTPKFFGLHIADFSRDPWPSVPFGGWRFTVAWRSVEPQKGVWDWKSTDAAVDAATQHGVDVLINMGFTPQWASSTPDKRCLVGTGQCAEPRDFQDWRDYVRTLATRYKGRVKFYEIWNEPDDASFYTGSDAGLIQLTRGAYEILKGIDPSIQVLSPAPGGLGGLALLDRFFRGGGGNYIDVVAYHFYVSPSPPDGLFRYIQELRQIMEKDGVGQKPIWTSEIGWSTEPLSDAKQAAYVSETLLIARAAGASRLFWYQWGNRSEVTLFLVQPDKKTLTPAGLAFKITQDWMLGAVVKCDSPDKPEPKKGASHALWTCTLQRGGNTSYVVWNPEGGGAFAVPTSWHVNRLRSLADVTEPLPATRQVILGGQPVLFDYQ